MSMREATSNYDFIIHENEFIGIALGWDFCAEHEWGIKGIMEDFKMAPKLTRKSCGINHAKINCVPKNLFFSKRIDNSLIILLNRYSIDLNSKVFPKKIVLDIFKYLLKYMKEEKSLSTAWDENSFGILVKGKQEQEYLRILYEAFEKLDIIITFLGKDNPFSNNSLAILIKSRLPNEFVNNLYWSHREVYDLNVYEKKIKMKEIKEKYGNQNGFQGEKYFMACSPRWLAYRDDDKLKKLQNIHNTKYKIMYWINYSDNDSNYGWYTVEEIKKWLTTEGLKLTQIRKA